MNCIREVYASEDSGSMVDAKEAGGDDKKLVLELQAAQRGLQSQVLEADRSYPNSDCSWRIY